MLALQGSGKAQWLALKPGTELQTIKSCKTFESAKIEIKKFGKSLPI